MMKNLIAIAVAIALIVLVQAKLVFPKPQSPDFAGRYNVELWQVISNPTPKLQRLNRVIDVGRGTHQVLIVPS
jgi:hypothetical protein